MRDLPNGAALLALARDLLLTELLPLLPEDRRLDARLVANAMVIAEREATAGAEPVAAIEQELELLYRDSPQAGRRGGEGDPLRRFAQDLRRGAFAGPRQRAARAILWRLTVARLRDGNPRFLAANGFS